MESTVLAIGAEDIPALAAGGRFFASAAAPVSALALTDWVSDLLREHGPVPLLRPGNLPPSSTCAAVGVVGSPIAMAELPPTGDEFVEAVRRLETRVGTRLAGVFPLAAAAVNALTPVVAAAQLGIPLLDADGMGRVFPLVQQTSLHLAGVPVAPVAAVAATGEAVLVEAASGARAEVVLRAAVTVVGGWAATASHACTSTDLARAGVPGTVSRLLAVGRVLLEGGTADQTVSRLAALTGARRVTRGRVVDLEHHTRPSDLAMPAHPSNVIVAEPDGGRLVRLEAQNDVLLVLADGAVIAAVPDIVCLLDAVRGGVASLDGLEVGDLVEVLVMPSAALWYTPDGLDLVGPRAFGLPLDHPRASR
jgi:uncharacterized protein